MATHTFLFYFLIRSGATLLFLFFLLGGAAFLFIFLLAVVPGCYATIPTVAQNSFELGS
jgi:hypothetical protein